MVRPAGAPDVRPVLGPCAVGTCGCSIATSPLATAPIGTAVVGVSARVPAGAPLACRINATILTEDWSPIEPGLSAGIVYRMRLNRSLVVRSRQAVMKL